jgi:hypothetical protein
MKDGVCLEYAYGPGFAYGMPGVDIEREMLRWEEKRNAKSIFRRGQDAYAGKGYRPRRDMR